MGVESIFCVNLLVDITVVVDIFRRKRDTTEGVKEAPLLCCFFLGRIGRGIFYICIFSLAPQDGNTYSHYRIFLFYFFFFRHLFDGFVRVVVVGTSLIGVIFS